MAMRARRGGGNGLDAWPGYVDALSTLLMVIIFVLLVFVLAQAFLSVALSGRDAAIEKMTRQMTELSDLLSLERGHTSELKLSVAGLGHDLDAANTARDSLARELTALHDAQTRLGAARDRIAGERDQLAARVQDAELRAGSAAARSAQLQAALDAAAGHSESMTQESATLSGQLADTRRALEAAQAQLAAMQAAIAERDRTVTADKATITAKLSDLAQLSEQVRALTALRDELEKQSADAAARAMTEQQRREAVAAQLADEQRLGQSARAQVALLHRQVEELKAQLGQVAGALDLAQTVGRDKDAQIANLGQRLNTALAAKVEELQRYRSEFFGRLREVLAGSKGIQVVGDRFVFQSEVLFPAGSAELSAAGQDQIRALAATVKEIATRIPPDVNWVLRVDGHADRQKITGGAFASNWELSAERAINVVKLLIAEGVPAAHLAATGFADNQPLDPADTPDAYARNRRIELRLTDR